MAEGSSEGRRYPSQMSPDLRNPILPSTSPVECYVCQQMMLGFRTPAIESFGVKLGGADILLRGNCPAHKSIAEKVNKNYLKSHSTLDDAEYKISKRENRTEVGLWIQEKGATSSSGVMVELVRSESDPNHHGRGRLLDSQWIELNLLKKWKEYCLKEHGSDCSNPLKQYHTERSTPDWLVDTQQRCLVKAHEDYVYVCLSYKWGQAVGLETTKANVSELQTINSLHKLWDEIPATIQNAIDIVKLLNERYLWVDRLCIIQDDEAMKSSQLQKMAGIYSNACVTIIVADGDNAEHGIRGIQGISQPRAEIQLTFPFGPTEKLICAKFRPFSVHNQGYFKRGWTFQEHLFSRRRLIFERGMVRWECNRNAWFEDIVFSTGPEAYYKPNWTAILHERFPSLEAYGSIISHYNHRQLTYPEDALPAIYGLLSILDQAFPDGFLCGLPEFYFDNALAWTPFTVENMRRVSSDLSPLGPGELTCLPSWSWVGWQGMVSAWNWRGDRDFIKKGRFGTSERTIPITKWYTAETPTSENKRLIRSRFLNEREHYKKATDPLRPGWTRHKYNAEDDAEEVLEGAYKYPPPDGCGEYYYTHIAAPNTEFWYPIPLSNKDGEDITTTTAASGPRAMVTRQDPISRISKQTPFLFTSTHRLHLHAFSKHGTKFHARGVLNLRNKKGLWAGILQLHHLQDLEQFMHEEPLGPTVELIAISRATRVNALKGEGLIEQDHEERPMGTELYEYYIVLWVEWKKGVAFRRAIGRVLKAVWESEGAEGVELVLG
jgi:hypothetical protein